MMTLHVSGMDIEAECNGEAVLWANLNAHELSSSKQSVSMLPMVLAILHLAAVLDTHILTITEEANGPLENK
jgi:hypothetical protein